MNNYALYYPTIEFNNYEWLWAASFLWDRIYRIVPSGYKPDDCENVRILTEAGEIGIPIQPDKYSEPVAKEFIDKLENGEWSAAALVTEVPQEYARLHKDKVDVKLRELIISKGSGASHEEWLHVPTQFGALYMTYLANYIASSNKLQLLSDSAAAWSGSTYFRFEGDVQDYPSEEYVQQLAVLVLRDFLPVNLLSLSPEQILKFRDKYRPERQRFLDVMQKSAHDLSLCIDPLIIKDMIADLKKDIEASLKDYRKAVETLNVTAWSGIKSLCFPLATTVAPVICGANLDSKSLFILSGLGVALGLVSGLADWKQKKKELAKNCDYSYLLHLGRNWQKSALYNNDYNYFLCREIEEFIND